MELRERKNWRSHQSSGLLISFLSAGVGKGKKTVREHYLPSLLMKLTRAKAWRRDPVAFERPGSKIFTRKTIYCGEIS